MATTNETALESHIQDALMADGYRAGEPRNFDSEFAVDTELFWGFLKETQAEELAKLRDRPDWRRLVLERLDKKIRKDSLLAVPKKGLDVDDAHFTFLYRLPYNELNPEVKEHFALNRFSLTRQVHYSQAEPLKSVDMVVFVNGLALATIELKNPWTGQNFANAVKQYREDRSTSETLFRFGRCLVHFAVDPNEVWMSARLDGADTDFLPFNKGCDHGKGNPPDPTGHRTSYLWRDILRRESLTNIIEHFVTFSAVKDKKTGKESSRLIFPRYHQLESVRSMLRDSVEGGVGRRFLIQHSAGSGKSNSITWLAYQLVELYDRTGTTNLFDSVVVVTDRRNLDTQIKDNIKLFAEVKNVVAHAESAAELKAHLEAGKKIIISTVQKFPFIVDGIEQLSDRAFAVIIDEAHSSQSGSSADQLNTALGADDTDEPEDLEEKILAAMRGRKMSRNASYYAFTATPKPATLEKFGVKDADGKSHPYHLYSMKQAIEEGFILDVLANYTTYKSYYEVKKTIEENPFFDSPKAQKKLRAYVEASKETIEAKAQVMVNHFMESVWGTKKMKGKAKAMVVTRNIEAAINYYQAIKKELKRLDAPFNALIAFSTSKARTETEDTLNGFPGKDIAKEFATDQYKFLVVANKFLTGFDEPQLHTMYVDKKLQGVLAVQALSRLNRSEWKLGKKDTFVLDFFNTLTDIKDAFDPYYTATSLSEPTDVNVLHDLKEKLDAFAYYEWSEVEHFTERYFSKAGHEELNAILNAGPVSRFEGLPEELRGMGSEDLIRREKEKIDFKIKAKQFVKIYAHVACIMPFDMVVWEKLHWFLKFLIPLLNVKDPDQDRLDSLLNSVDLSTYGLERSKVNERITLDATPTTLEPHNPNVRGYHETSGDKNPLDEIVRLFNERWFSGWDVTPGEQRVKLISIARSVANHPDYRAQVLNNPDAQNRRLAMEKLIQDAFGRNRKHELELYRKHASDPDFQRAFDNCIVQILEKGLYEIIGVDLGGAAAEKGA